jgi:trk system potassium uptake protein TrkA
MQGDGTSIQVLDDAGARNCDSFLAITPHDEDNLVGCQIASGKFGIPTVMATVNDPDNVDVFRALGIESVISTTDLISSVIEKRTRFDTVIQLLPLGSGKIIAAEVLLEEKSPATDRQIMDLELPPGVLIAAVERDGEIVIPKGDTLLRVYDHLTILCREESYAKAIRAVSEG